VSGRRRFHLVLFDLDGTLVDSCPDIQRALNHVLREHGLETHSVAEVRRMIGGGVGKLIERAAPALSAASRDPLAEAFRARYAIDLVRDTVAYPGVDSVVRVAPDVRKAVLTNKPGGLARRLVSACGWQLQFEGVLGDDDLPRRKPDPIGVERLRASAGVPREAVLYVGDSPIDFETARAAGVPCALVTWGYTDRHELAVRQPDFLIDEPAALKALVGSRVSS
jgi:phosphoglycolate phosphatase